MSSLKGSAYKILEEAGTGAFGKVYVGLATKFSTKVAIKKCRRLNSGDDRKTPDPIAEAKILKDLSKINDSRHVIAQYIDSFVEGDYHYLVMDYCPHGSIFDYVCKERNNRPLTEDHVSDVIFDILTAVEFIHGAGYVHRDLSPKNVLIHSFTDDSTPKIKIVDFGLAKKIHLINNTVAGTPGFYNRDRMKKGYSLDVDFYAIGCVMYFLMTNKLLLDKENKPPSIQVVETSLRERKVSVDAINLIKHLLTDVKIASAQVIKMDYFFTKTYRREAEIQASTIRNSRESHVMTCNSKPLVAIENQQNEMRKFFDNNRYHYQPQVFKKAASQAYSLPTKLVRNQPSKLSVATSASPLPWPLPVEFRGIIKNVMVNKFGRAIMRGPQNLFIVETLNFNEKSRCTYVGRLLNACENDQELRIYKPINTFLLPDFTTYPNGIPECELKLVDQIRTPADFETTESKAAFTMYSRMRSILRVVGDMVRKREENPNMIVDVVAKLTWNGIISVELPDKQVISWPARAQRPPVRDYQNLSTDIVKMLNDVHADFSRVIIKK